MGLAPREGHEEEKEEEMAGERKYEGSGSGSGSGSSLQLVLRGGAKTSSRWFFCFSFFFTSLFFFSFFFCVPECCRALPDRSIEPVDVSYVRIVHPCFLGHRQDKRRCYPR